MVLIIKEKQGKIYLFTEDLRNLGEKERKSAKSKRTINSEYLFNLFPIHALAEYSIEIITLVKSMETDYSIDNLLPNHKQNSAPLKLTISRKSCNQNKPLCKPK